jgi:hypothetical protein
MKYVNKEDIGIICTLMIQFVLKLNIYFPLYAAVIITINN